MATYETPRIESTESVDALMTFVKKRRRRTGGGAQGGNGGHS